MSSIPHLASLSLHGDAGWIVDLNPDPTQAGLIGVIDLLRHDTLGAKPASMSEHNQPILGNVLVEQDARFDLTPAL
jgi:hypothetical protein